MAKCYSARCADAPSHRLGPLRAESDAYLTSAVRVNVEYMEYRPVTAAASACGEGTHPERPAEAADGVAAFSAAVDRWLRRDAHVLSVRSPMGTGKSTFLDRLLRTMREANNSRGELTVLVVTYRMAGFPMLTPAMRRNA